VLPEDSSCVVVDGDDSCPAGTVRIWDVATGQPRAFMRLDSDIAACAWLGRQGLAVGGTAGLYLFDLMTEPMATASEHGFTDPGVAEPHHRHPPMPPQTGHPSRSC